ncbi:MAG: tetratricopeptide repeat protein, partial [Phycisphaerales bacterium]|nr:tetratricopeptide repeat protein [Phycisphaerales bacterium]
MPEQGAKQGLLARLPAASPLRGLRDLWQIPTIVLALVLLGAGMRSWVAGRPAPDFDGAMDQIETLIDDGHYPEARELLAGNIFPELGSPEVTVAQRGRYHLLQADRMYLEQKQLGLDVDENHRRIIEEYELGERIGLLKLDGERLGRIADALMSLGEEDRAHQRIMMIPSSEVERRQRLLQRLIDTKLARGNEGLPDALAYLRDMLRDPEIAPRMRLWAVLRQAEVRINSGYTEEAITRLLVEVARLDSWEAPGAGELFLTLGQAYFSSGQIDEAEVHAERAAGMIEEGTPLFGEVEVLRGRINQARSEFEEARDRYARVVEEYRETPALLSALLGLAEVEAALGNGQAALDAYRTMVDRMSSGLTSPRVSREMVADSIDQFYRSQMDSYRYDDALRFALLIRELWGGDGAPPEATQRIAWTKRRHALHLIDDDEGEQQNFMVVEPINFAQLDPVTREQVRSLFSEAARDFRAYARLVVARPAEGAEALLLAGDCFDRAGEIANALETFQQYEANHRDAPHLLDVRFRIAQAYEALGNDADAIKAYEAIIESDSTTQHAYRSYVPLARCNLRQAGEDAARRAEGWLMRVLDGTYFDPSSREYQDALTELARMYRRVGRYDDAIVRLEEVLDRYPGTEQRAQLNNDLADALRLSAADIARTLREQMPQNRRRDLEVLRHDRLSRALRLYQQVRDELDAPDRKGRSPVEEVVLRNAIFYRGDCAY